MLLMSLRSLVCLLNTVLGAHAARIYASTLLSASYCTMRCAHSCGKCIPKIGLGPHSKRRSPSQHSIRTPTLLVSMHILVCASSMLVR